MKEFNKVMTEENKEEYLNYCKAVHSTLKSFINAAINTKIYGDTLVVIITRFNFKYKQVIPNVTELVKGGEQGVIDTVQAVDQGYTKFIFDKFFYDIKEEEEGEEDE